MGRLRVLVKENQSGESLAFRAYLTDERGEFHRPSSAHVFFRRAEEEHVLAEGSFEAELPPGTYRLRVERGPEFAPFDEAVAVSDGETTQIEVILKRWVWMNSCHWYSGDLHVHRSPDEMRLAVLAEDLNVGTNIIFHNKVSPEAPPSVARETVNDVTAYSTLDAEIERLNEGPGAVVLLGMNEPLDVGDLDALYPPDIHYTDLAREQGAHIDAEKPFWRGTPVNAALGVLDSMGVVPNHFHRQKVMRESARWGAIPQEAQFVGDAGFAKWILDLYYRFLNCGIRLPASAGTASGIMPSPLGYCRTYVKMEDGFGYDEWFTALRNGRSFATNGPMLFLTVDDHDPGALLRYAVGEPAPLSVRAVGMSQGALDSVELIQDGRVIERVVSSSQPNPGLFELETEVVVRRSGWLAARCFEKIAGNVRYAQTSPVYVFMGTDQIASEADGRYFLEIVERQIRQSEEWTQFREEAHRAELLAMLVGARDFYRMAIDLAREREL